MTCSICGAEFERCAKNQRYCSQKCAKVAAKRRSRCYGPLRLAMPVSNETIMHSRRKPKDTSDVRWRMELRRRLNPDRYAYAGVM